MILSFIILSKIGASIIPFNSDQGCELTFGKTSLSATIRRDCMWIEVVSGTNISETIIVAS